MACVQVGKRREALLTQEAQGSGAFGGGGAKAEVQAEEQQATKGQVATGQQVRPICLTPPSWTTLLPPPPPSQTLLPSAKFSTYWSLVFLGFAHIMETGSSQMTECNVH